MGERVRSTLDRSSQDHGFIIQQVSLFKFLQRVMTDVYSCVQEGSPVVVCVAADLKKPLTEDSVAESSHFVNQ